MKRILLLGYSYIAQKAIIPALSGHPKVKLVGIASKTKYSRIDSRFKAFNDYKEAIKKSDCDTVYISLHNSAHFDWITYSLNQNKNIICDKPAVLSAKEARECYKLAGNRLLIFESLSYLYHPQHKKIKILLDKKSQSPQLITVQFGFPPLSSENFRNYKSLGGGCIYDLGPYIVSTGQYYFNQRVDRVSCFVNVSSKNQIPVSAAVTLYYPGNKTLQGYVGFDLEYRNSLGLWGENFYLGIDRAFTIPKDYINTIHYKTNDLVKDITVPATDAFRTMFSYYANIRSSSYSHYNHAFLERAELIELLNRAAETGRIENYEH